MGYGYGSYGSQKQKGANRGKHCTMSRPEKIQMASAQGRSYSPPRLQRHIRNDEPTKNGRQNRGNTRHYMSSSNNSYSW